MNQRSETRPQANQSVAITLFGDPDVRLFARVKNISGRGIGLVIERPVAPGTALKVELEDALLLGEVIFCRREEASYYVAAELEHALCGLGELSRTVREFHEGVPDLGLQRGQPMVISRYQSQKQPH